MAKAKQLLKSGRLIKTNTPLVRVRGIPRWREKRHFDFTVTWKVLIAGWGLVFSDKRKSGVKMMRVWLCSPAVLWQPFTNITIVVFFQLVDSTFTKDN